MASTTDLINIVVKLRGGRAASAQAKRLAGALNTFSGRLGLLTAAAQLAGPALVALSSSLAGAGAGFAILGGAAVTSAIVGLGGVFKITGQLREGIDKVQASIKSYRIAVKGFGRDSSRAESAFKTLQGTLAVYGRGGQKPLLQAVHTLDRMSKAWDRLTVSARGSLIVMFRDGVRAAARLMPTYAAVTNRVANRVQISLSRMFETFSGPEAKASLLDFGGTFARITGPIGKGFTGLLWGVIRLFRAALPFIESGARAFKTFGYEVLGATSDGRRLSEMVGNLVGHLRAWWRLLKALGRLSVAVFGSSEESGKGLVRWLTRGVDRLTAFVTAARKSGEAAVFFRRFGDLVTLVVGMVERLAATVQGLIYSNLPGLSAAIGSLDVVVGLWLLRLRLIIEAISFLGPALGPLIATFIGLRLAIVAVTFATKLWGIALRLTPLGWIVTGIGLVILAVVTMYNKWAWFRNAVKGVWAALREAWGWLDDRISGALDRWSKRWQDMTRWIRDAIAAVKDFVAAIPKALGKGEGGGILGLGGIDKFGSLGGRAAGGPVTAGMPYVVGERRAEVFVPDRDGTVLPSVPQGRSLPERITLVLPDGRLVGEYLTSAVLDADARR